MAIVLALGVHVAVFTLAPPYVPRPYQLREPPLRLVSAVEMGTGEAESAAPPPTGPVAAPRLPSVVTEQLELSAPPALSPTSARSERGASPPFVPGGGQADAAPPVFYAFDTPPRATRRVEPEYPASAKIQGAQGTVIVNANIDEQGRIMRVWVVQSTAPEILIQAALDAIYQFEFSPGSAHGYPVKCTVAVPFDFRLNQHL